MFVFDASYLCCIYCHQSVEHGPNMVRIYIKTLVDVE